MLRASHSVYRVVHRPPVANSVAGAALGGSGVGAGRVGAWADRPAPAASQSPAASASRRRDGRGAGCSMSVLGAGNVRTGPAGRTRPAARAGLGNRIGRCAGPAQLPGAGFAGLAGTAVRPGPGVT